MTKFFLLLGFLLPSFALAGKWSGRGEVTIESRTFEGDDNENTVDSGLGIFTRVESVWEQGGPGNWSTGLRLYGRVDEKDKNRSLAVLEEAKINYYSENDEGSFWKVSAGHQLFNWTALEAFHPADEVHSRNLDSNIENFEKKGELTLSLDKSIGEDGLLSIYFWPKFEAPAFPSAHSRLGLATIIARPVWYDGSAHFESEYVMQGGLRYSDIIFDGDFSLHYLYHVDRNHPIIGTSRYVQGIPTVGNPTGLTFLETPNTPHYFKVHQVGGTYQYPWDAFVFKLETAHRSFEAAHSIGTVTGVRQAMDHHATAGGVEYLVTHTGGSQSIWLLEAQFLYGANQNELDRLEVFQNDGLLGYRYALNDTMGKEFQLIGIIDLNRSHERFYNFSYSQRLSDQWKIKGGLRIFDAPQKGAVPVGLEVLNNDNYFTLDISRYF